MLGRVSRPNFPSRGSRQLRKGRVSIPSQIYLVTTRTDRGRPLFTEFTAGRTVVDALRREERHAQTLAFVVMPDHLHWLMQLTGSRALSGCVNTVKSYSARTLNRIRHRGGAVWQTGFHDHALRREKDLENVARYVVMNPVRAGLVRNIREYPLWDAIWV